MIPFTSSLLFSLFQLCLSHHPRDTYSSKDSLDGSPFLSKLEMVGFPSGEVFHPHGISLLKTAEGDRYLFAVNHRKGGDYVEVFQYKDNKL